MWGEISYILCQLVYDCIPLVMLFLQHERNFRNETQEGTIKTMGTTSYRSRSQWDLDTTNIAKSSSELKGSLIQNDDEEDIVSDTQSSTGEKEITGNY